MSDLEEQKQRDFNARTEEDKQAFLENTWCDQCQEVNLGLYQPNEYEQGKTIYIEGKCKKCHAVVITELTEDDF